MNRESLFQIDPSPFTAQLNAEKIQFPITIRKWMQGDRFIPLGMKSKKLISDYFIDEKFSMIEKEQCWLLTSGEDVIWIIGNRIDDRYKITPQTRSILEIKLKDLIRIIPPQ
jgi:tRNA(Ile)-lysidine synthase